MFQQKLSFAAATNLQNLTSIYKASEAFSRTKSLWGTALKDPYGDTDPDVEKAVDVIVNTARRGYNQATTQGMPVKGQFGYAGFLTNMDKSIQALNALGPFENLDPRASNALSLLTNALQKANSEFVPVGIASPVQHIQMPEDTIYGTPPGKPSGAAYPGGADPRALEDVVNNLTNKPQ